jgi:serine/threonine-protein kinase HipA
MLVRRAKAASFAIASAPALWILSSAPLKRRVAELSQAILDASPGAIEEMNKMKQSAAYKETAQYGRGHCRSMLTNLKTDVQDVPEEEDEATSAVQTPGRS